MGSPLTRRCSRPCQSPSTLSFFSLACGRQQVHDAVGEAGQVEVRHLKAELAGFELGQIEQVVEDHQQALSRILRRGCVGALLGIELRFHQHGGHAHDRVHRRADLVAHHGEEVGLGARPGLGGVLGGAQLVLGLLTLGDIPDREHDFEAVVVVGDAAGRQFDVEQVPVAVLGQRFAGAQRLLPQRLPPDVFGAGREQDVDRLAVQVRRLPAEDMADVVVEAGDVVVLDHHDAVERGLGQLLKPQAGARQLQLAVLELGDVGGDGDHLAATGAALGDLQPAVAHEGLFEGGAAG